MFTIKNLSMIYDMDTDEKMYALKGLELSLPDKGLIGIIGPSGSGKSTLMYCLSTLKKPTDGSV
ncbi:MAG: ATP-binding cassette domain-containing protein, partial [Lachnospiraceae bacterium]|nr:ATP-binding cassette domain-containing protein [Lachnospiraceae bacterium]